MIRTIRILQSEFSTSTKMAQNAAIRYWAFFTAYKMNELYCEDFLC